MRIRTGPTSTASKSLNNLADRDSHPRFLPRRNMDRPTTFPDHHLAGLFFQRVQELGGRTFLKLQRGDGFAEMSWRDFGAQVCAAVIGLCAIGLVKGDAIGIIGENSLEWLCAD